MGETLFAGQFVGVGLGLTPGLFRPEVVLFRERAAGFFVTVSGFFFGLALGFFLGPVFGFFFSLGPGFFLGPAFGLFFGPALVKLYPT